MNAAEEALKQDQMLQSGCALDILQEKDVIEVESVFEKEHLSNLFS
jgi:hypothetical protein